MTPPSGQYGDLKQTAWDAAIRWHHSEVVRAILELVHPIYAAALEAKDREIEELKSGAFLDKAGLAHDLAIEAAQMSEQREAEARYHLALVTDGFAAPEEWERRRAAAVAYLESKP